MPKPTPIFGQRTRYYPYGYGYCQCGCGQVSREWQSGEFAMYIHGHHDSLTSSDQPKARRKAPRENIGATPNLLARQSNKVKKYAPPDQRLLDQYADLVAKYGVWRRQAEPM